MALLHMAARSANVAAEHAAPAHLHTRCSSGSLQRLYRCWLWLAEPRSPPALTPLCGRPVVRIPCARRRRISSASPTTSASFIPCTHHVVACLPCAPTSLPHVPVGLWVHQRSQCDACCAWLASLHTCGFCAPPLPCVDCSSAVAHGWTGCGAPPLPPPPPRAPRRGIGHVCHAFGPGLSLFRC